MKKFIGLMLVASVLSACGPNTKDTVQTVKPLKTTQNNAAVSDSPQFTDLFETILKGSEAQVIEALNNNPALNQTNRFGLTPFHYILASSSPKVVALALQKGADPNAKAGNIKVVNAIDFALAANGLKQTPQFKQEGIYFSMAATASNKPNRAVLSRAEAEALIEKITMVRSYLYQADWLQDHGLNKLDGDYQAWSQKIKQKMAVLSRPIAEIPKPSLPPVQTFEKDPFETLAMFKARMEKAKSARESQTNQIMKDYRQKVEARNAQVKSNSERLKALQTEIAQTNAEYPNKRAKLFAQAEAATAKQQQTFLAESFAQVYGVPKLSAIEEAGKPKYDPEKGLMFATLSYSGIALKQEVTLPVKAGQAARDFYTALKSNKIQPKSVFKFSSPNSYQVTFARLDVDFKGQQYNAQLNRGETFVAQAPIQVVLQNKELTPQLQQNQVDAVVFDAAAVEQLALQNPNMKDVQFENFLLNQQKAFEDDIPQLFTQAKNAPIDRTKWLFVIGIGQYEQTDDILYSRRSADWFAKVASKTLGIQKGRQIVLLDKQASSGAIKDQLKLMLSKVKTGDEIIFYYSGHGLPVIEKGNQPYMLPTDNIPDFIADDDFYQVQNIYRKLENSKASRVVAFMDSCFTGQTDGKSVFAGAKAATRLQPKSYKASSKGKIAILTAGNDKQFSNAYTEKGHRLFSYYLIKAMLKGYGQIGDLATKVKGEVNDKSLDLGGLNRQTPVFIGNPNLNF